MSDNIYDNLDVTSKTILIVDDNPANLKVLGTMLENIGFNIRVAKSGEECLKSISLLKPDIILLDIHMPGMDGYEVCRIIKSNNDLKDIPVIFISALTEKFHKSKAFELIGVDYIIKPFELKDIELRVKTHLFLREEHNKLIQSLKDLKDKEQKLITSEKMYALGILTAGIAHEINNLINAISNNFKALKNIYNKLNNYISEIDNKKISQKIKDFFIDLPKIYIGISVGLEYIENIIKSLKIYSRIDSGQSVMVNVDEIIESSLLILHHKYKDIVIIKKNLNSSRQIRCSAGQIGQIFINILSNSIDAIKELKEILKDQNREVYR